MEHHHAHAHHMLSSDPHHELALNEQLAQEYAQLTHILHVGQSDGQDEHHDVDPQAAEVHGQEPGLDSGQPLIDPNLSLQDVDFLGPNKLDGTPALRAPGSAGTHTVCLVKDCTNTPRPRGRLCSLHQKRKERAKGSAELEMKEEVYACKGRPPKPFSQGNKKKKLKHLDDVINSYGGSRDEGTKLVKEYISSHFWEKRFEGDVPLIFERIGRNFCEFIQHELPPHSTFRLSLLSAVVKDISPKDVREVLDTPETVISRAKNLPKADNLLLQHPSVGPKLQLKEVQDGLGNAADVANALHAAGHPGDQQHTPAPQAHEPAQNQPPPQMMLENLLHAQNE
jgi:hypothetical protein